MSVVAADLVQFAAASMPADDSSTSGGAIDLLRRIDFTQIAAADKIEVVSSAAGDTTQTVTLTGRLASGSIVAETLTLNGTTAVPTAANYERLLKAEMSATAVGTVTVRRQTGPATLRVIPIGERGIMAIFRQDTSDPSVQKDYYCKFFWKNTHATLSLLTALVTESADPDSRITHALDASVNASTSVANRVTSPGFTFNGTDKAVPGTDLAAGAAIGVWLNLTLPAADAVHKTTYTSGISGQST